MPLGLPFQPSVVLAAYSEPVLEGRLVLVVGSALSPLAEQVLERGARAVHVCDGDPLRVAEATAKTSVANLSFSTLENRPFELRDGTFDVALVEHLEASRPQIWVKTVRRSLSRKGVALFACPNLRSETPLLPLPGTVESTLDYYALYDVVAAEFPHVRMLGQAPFMGYAIADFAPRATPEPALDTGFIPGGAEEPDWFIALASDFPTRLDEFLVVQLPTRRVFETFTSRAQQALSAVATRPELAAVIDLTAEAEFDDETGPLRQNLGGSAAAGARAEEEAQKQAELQGTLLRQNAWITVLEQRSLVADDRADQAEVQINDLTERCDKAEAEAQQWRTQAGRTQESMEQAGGRLVEAEAELAVVRQERREASERMQHLELEANRLRAELKLRDATIAELEARHKTAEERLSALVYTEDQDAVAELTLLEQKLLERGTELQRLELELRDARRVGRELVRKLQTSSGASERSLKLTELSAKLQELSAALAQREADLLAATWTVDALSTRLEKAEASVDQHAPG